MSDEAEPYGDVHSHLRDELWRVWLRVEYQVRHRWELGTLPRVSDDAALGVWTPDNIAGIFRGAHADYAGQRHTTVDAGAKGLLAAFLRHCQLVDGRIRATLLERKLRLPMIDISQRFRLSSRQLASLCFAMMPEVDPHLLTAYRYLAHDPTCRGLDARLLAMLVYDTPESRAHLSLDLSPLSPLLYFRLLEQEDGGGGHESMLYRRLRPSARLVQRLTGDEDQLDPQLAEYAELKGEPAPGLFPEGLLGLAEAALRSPEVLVVLQGQRGVGKRHLLQLAAARLGLRLLVIDGRRLASLHLETARPVLRSLLRESRLLDAVLVIPEVDDLLAHSGEAESDELPGFVSTLCREHVGPIALTVARERMPRIDMRPVVHVTVELPTLEARRHLWRHVAPDLTDEDAATLSERFATPGGIITMAARAAAASRLAEVGPPDVTALDLAVRNQLHDRILRLGRKLHLPYTFDDLVVDEELREALWEIIACVRDRRTVREKWGMKGAPGVSVLFSGDPGVGKTMSATVVARQLGLAAYEVDLSRVTSKWIGETEKNLSEVFDAAEPGHVVLLFNEADSLFGKRTTDVKTSNDRYANLETNYLLQRLERFGGLAILTTNLGKAIDPAFRRRFAYDVQFSFPTAEMRAELWRRAIPRAALTEPLDFGELSERFELSGGFIKVAAERSAFMAAGGQKPLTLALITVAVERMYRERGKLAAIGHLE